MCDCNSACIYGDFILAVVIGAWRLGLGLLLGGDFDFDLGSIMEFGQPWKENDSNCRLENYHYGWMDTFRRVKTDKNEQSNDG